VIQTLLSTVCPGDDVLIPAPYWTSYPDMVKMCGARPVSVPTKAEDGYVLTAAVLREALKAHPKATCIILCNPSNPTGAVAGEKELKECAEVLLDYPKVCTYVLSICILLMCLDVLSI
jgi:aspartate aminotransferase